MLQINRKHQHAFRNCAPLRGGGGGSGRVGKGPDGAGHGSGPAGPGSDPAGPQACEKQFSHGIQKNKH